MKWMNQILQYMDDHEEEMIADIIELVKIKSVYEKPLEGMPFGLENANALAYMLEKAKKAGFFTKNYDNYVGRISSEEKEIGLDILAHLDVVPAGDWEEAFVPKRENGFLYGRGVADDKGPAIAVFYAMRCIKELQIPLKKQVNFIVGCDEERGSSDLEYYFTKEKAAPYSLTPDAEFPVINLEKGRYAPEFFSVIEKNQGQRYVEAIMCEGAKNVIPAKAFAWIKGLTPKDMLSFVRDGESRLGVQILLTQEKTRTKIEVMGIGGHASTPNLANNALTALLDFICELPLDENDSLTKINGIKNLFPHGDWNGKALGVAMHHPIAKELTVSLNTFSYENQHMIAAFDSRLPLGATEENVKDTIYQMLAKQQLHLKEAQMSAVHYVDENTKFIKTLLDVYEVYSGKKGECIAIGGGTYVHHIENGVAFGPTSNEYETNIHGEGERIKLTDLKQCAGIYAQVMIELCS